MENIADKSIFNLDCDEIVTISTPNQDERFHAPTFAIKQEALPATSQKSNLGNPIVGSFARRREASIWGLIQQAAASQALEVIMKPCSATTLRVTPIRKRTWNTLKATRMMVLDSGIKEYKRIYKVRRNLKERLGRSQKIFHFFLK